MRTILIEDEPFLLHMMERFIHEEPAFDWMGSFTDPMEALDYLNTQEIDLIFLDIEMPQINGIELAKRLPAQTQVVFTTAHRHYAVEAFDLHATHYLLKPITSQMIRDLVPRVTSRYEATHRTKPTRSCTIQCFDHFSVTTSNGEFIKWPTQKTEELFAYMLFHQNQVMNKWLIAEALYPNTDDPQRALHNVYNLVYRLKKTLTEYQMDASVQTMNNGYSLHLDTCRCDYYEWLAATDKPFPISEVKTRLFVDKDYSWH